jgi:hypothetical protein
MTTFDFSVRIVDDDGRPVYGEHVSAEYGFVMGDSDTGETNWDGWVDLSISTMGGQDSIVIDIHVRAETFTVEVEPGSTFSFSV